VRAALSAERGVSGPKGSLDGRFGVCGIYEKGDPAVVADGLGTRFDNEVFTFKKFSTCACGHGPIQAALDLVAEHDIAAEEIAAVRVVLTPYSHRLVGALFDPGPDPRVAALQRNFSNLNALVAITSDSNRYLLQIYDTLYGFDGAGELIPRVALSYETADDDLTYVYHLRRGVRFHHGGELTADDVKFSLEHVLDPASKSTRRPQFAPIIRAVEAPDPQTVVFRLKAPDGAFPNKIAGYLPLVPRDYGSSQPAADFFARSPISVGPYKVKAFSDGESLDLERFEDYWDEKPGVRRLLFKVIPEPDSRINALPAGEVDLAARGEIFRKISRILHEDAAGVFISELYDTFAKKSAMSWTPQQGIGLLNFRKAAWG
jgi:ABC-type transport system substrate-binding protein